MPVKRQPGVVGNRLLEIPLGASLKAPACHLVACVYKGIGWVLGEGLAGDVGLPGLKYFSLVPKATVETAPLYVCPHLWARLCPCGCQEMCVHSHIHSLLGSEGTLEEIPHPHPASATSMPSAHLDST